MSPAAFHAAIVWPVRGRSFSHGRVRSITRALCGKIWYSAASDTRSSRSTNARWRHRPERLSVKRERLERRLAEREACQARELERARREFERREQRLPPGLSRRSRALYGAVELLGKAQAFILTKLLDEPVWRAGDGRVMRVRDMNNAHLFNAIQLLRRRTRLCAESSVDAGDDPIKLTQLLKEARRRAGTDVTDRGRKV